MARESKRGSYLLKDLETDLQTDRNEKERKKER